MPPAEGLAHSPCRPALSASHPGPVTLPRPLGPGESYFRRSRSLCQSSTLTPLSLQPSQPGWWLLRALHTRPHQRAAPQARPASDRAAALQDHRSTYRELDHRPLDLTTQAHVTVSHPHPPQKARHHWASTLQSHHCIGATLLVTWKRIYFNFQVGRCGKQGKRVPMARYYGSGPRTLPTWYSEHFPESKVSLCMLRGKLRHIWARPAFLNLDPNPFHQFVIPKLSPSSRKQ